MNSKVSYATICTKDKENITYAVCDIKYAINEDDTFCYTFIPRYSVIDLLSSDVFQGIPGLDLDLRKAQYERKNILPTFISERVPSDNREGLQELLEKVDLGYLDPIEYLIMNKNKYSGDDFFAVPYKQTETIQVDNKLLSTRNTREIMLLLLENIALGNDIDGEYIVNDRNRADIYKVLIKLYRKSTAVLSRQQGNGRDIAKKSHRYKGRKPIKVDFLRFQTISNQINNGQLSLKEGLSILGIKKDKYYRLKKASR